MIDMYTHERYKRQISIEGWGIAAQEKIAAAKVCVAGIGGLGSPVSTYLAAAGIGTLVLCDYQNIDLSNLNRQVLYRTADIGKEKLRTARDRLTELNPEISVEIVEGRITDDSAARAFSGADLIVDCLDNFETRFVLNRFAVAEQIPFIHAGIMSLYGQMVLLAPPKTACLRCFISPDAAGGTAPPPVLGATAGVVGSMEAAEALKVIAGLGDEAFGVLHTVDLMTFSFDSIALQKNPECPVCGNG
jgi:adenylyltransferase/sulfurtransferase